MAIRVSIDFKSKCDTWWAAARSSPDAPEAVRPLLDPAVGPDNPVEVLVTPDVSTEIYMWASDLPGWDEGFAQKRLPLMFVKVPNQPGH